MVLFNMFQSKKNIQKVSYENIQDIVKGYVHGIIINTLPFTDQSVTISKSIDAIQEETIINGLIEKNNYNDIIVIYGKNVCDQSVVEKYISLEKHGFTNIYIYAGGLFEWLCLQDIYGNEWFPTKGKTLDILKYKPNKISLNTK